jgi:MFS family permease
MIQVLATSWALLLGIFLLMVGNGLQGTLLGVRGAIEGFSTFEMSIVMAAYFAGFLGGSRLAPEMIRRVGHVRVFAALGSFVSAAVLLFPVVTEPITWTALRVVIGFCFSGLYVTAESWLNNSSSNENRGKALSLYLIMQMAGIVTAQGILALGDPSGFILFIIPSVLVSISFAPILLSVTPAPAFETTKPMSFSEIYHASPLGCVGIFLLGGVFSALFGMASVYAAQSGMSLQQVSTFIAAIYLGGLVLQYPIGYMSDHMDRRILIGAVAAFGAVAAAVATLSLGGYSGILVMAFLIGGSANPLYALLIAHTNDFLEHEDMAAASGRLIFINGVGAVAGPVITGQIMTAMGPSGFFVFISLLLALIAIYAGYRMTQRAGVSVEETVVYQAILPTASPVAMEVAQEVAIENAEEAAAEEEIGNLDTVSRGGNTSET